MDMNKPIYRKMLFCEVALAYALPCCLLGLGTVFIFIPIGVLLNGEIEGLYILSLVIGGYLGIMGVFSQFNAIVFGQGDKRPVGPKNFIFTLVGCFTASPIAYLGITDGSFITATIGCAPIIVAMQLTYMNRNELKMLINRNLRPKERVEHLCLKSKRDNCS